MILAILTTCTYAQVSYRVLRGDQQIGEARISQRLLQDGGKYTELVVVLNGLEVRSRSTLDRNGQPLRDLLDLTPEGKPPSKQVIVTFDADGANVVVKSNGVPSSQHVTAPTGASRSDPYEFWFLRDHPKVGDHCHSLNFNVDTQKWVSTDVTYLGPVEEGFRTILDQPGRHTETVFGKDGYPVSITDSHGLRFVRVAQGKS